MARCTMRVVYRKGQMIHHEVLAQRKKLCNLECAKDGVNYEHNKYKEQNSIEDNRRTPHAN